MLQVKHYSPYELRRKQRRAQWLTGSLLCVLGVVLEVVYLALYPWLDGRTAQAQHDAVRGAWETLLPWLSSIYQQLDWTAYAQHLYQWPAYLRGHLYPLLLLLLAALLLVLLAAAAAGRSERVLRYNLFAERPLFVIIFMLTCAFGLTMLVSPIHGNIFAQDMFLSGLAGPGLLFADFGIENYAKFVISLYHEATSFLWVRSWSARSVEAAAKAGGASSIGLADSRMLNFRCRLFFIIQDNVCGLIIQ